MTDARALLDELRPQIRDERVLAAIAAVPRTAFVPAAGGRGLGQPGARDRLRPDDLTTARRRADGRAARRGAPATACSTSAPGRATTRRSWRRSAATSGRSSATPSSAARRPGRWRRRGCAASTSSSATARTACRAHGPYDAVNVAAATPEADLEPFEAQLAPGGRLVVPVVVRRRRQRLVLVERGPKGWPGRRSRRSGRPARAGLTGSARQRLRERHRLGEEVALLARRARSTSGASKTSASGSPPRAPAAHLVPGHRRRDRRALPRAQRVDATRSSCARRSGSSRRAPCRRAAPWSWRDDDEVRLLALEQLGDRAARTPSSAS